MKQTFTTGQVLTAQQMTNLQATAMLGGAANAKVASYVLVAADAGDAITMSNAGATTITVNTGLFAEGDIVTIINLGAGACTITAGTATVATSGSLVLATNQGGVLRFTSASAAIFFQFATPASGDIEGVTAGTGISGGGTSGTVTITNSMATAIDAKGDLVAGTGADTFARLAVGANGTTLVADSAEATGLKWATPAGGGGGMTLLTSGSLSGTSTTISFTPTGYINALLVIQGGSISSNDQLFFRINGNSGGVYQSSYTTRQGSTAGANAVGFTNNGTYLLTDGTSSASTDINATFLVFEVAKSANHAFQCNLNYVTGLGEAQNNWTGKINDTNTVTSMSIHTLAGSATFSGNYYLYGVK